MKNIYRLNDFKRFLNDLIEMIKKGINMETIVSIKEMLDNLKFQHENVELEFKTSTDRLSKDFWPTYSAFANTSGGYIILGIQEKPKFEVVGINNPERIITDMFNTANNPSKASRNIIDNKNIAINVIEGKQIITVYIPELANHLKPLYLNGNYNQTYLRKNEGDYLASEEDLRRFIRNSQDNNDGELLDNYTIDDLNTTSILSFKNIVHERQPSKNYLTMDNQHFLNEMGVFQIDRCDNRKEKLTLAGLLFLGKFNAIVQKVPHFHLEYINQRGISTGRWKDRVSTGDLNYQDLNLFDFYRIVLSKLRETIEDPFELDENSVRKTHVELETALRESLGNVLIHADYLDPETMVKITVKDLYYMFLNPGSMKVSEHQFFMGGKSYPRNNTLITFFRRIGASERSGTGGPDIIKYAINYKYRLPELKTDYKSTEIKLWVASPAASHPEFSNHENIVYEYLSHVVEAKVSDIESATGLNKYFIRKALKKLIEKKAVNNYGKGPATRYFRNPSIVEKVSMLQTIQEYLTRIDDQ